MTPVKILCLETQSWTLSYADNGKVTSFGGSGGGGRGRMDSGIHGAFERVSFKIPDALSTCLSM